jgi:hypothetical protein
MMAAKKPFGGKGAPPFGSKPGGAPKDKGSYPKGKQAAGNRPPPPIGRPGITYKAPAVSPTTKGGIPTDPGAGFSQPDSITKVNEKPMKKTVGDIGQTGMPTGQSSKTPPVGSYGGKGAANGPQYKIPDQSGSMPQTSAGPGFGGKK